MNKLIWLIESDVFDINSVKKLQNSINKNSHMDYIDINLNDLVIGKYTRLLKNNSTIYYGSLFGSQFIREKYPNINCKNYCTLEMYEFFRYSHFYKTYMVNSYYSYYYSVDRFCKFSLINQPYFIRPNSGNKCFTGHIITPETFKQNKDFLINECIITDEETILAFPVKDIIREWRFIVSKNDVITGSLYLDKTTNLDYNKNYNCAKNLADSLIKKVGVYYYPDDLYTMDICELKGGEIKLLELNSFSCAGLYDCDYNKLIEYINKEIRNDL